MKAGLYARVSTDLQVDGYSIESQKELLVNYAKSKEYNEYEFYIDGGYSGKNLDRPEMKRLVDDIKKKKIDCVMVFKLDRISRNQRDTLYLIEEVFNKYEVGFISIRENFDTTSPFGKAMIGILSVFAQLERETILERTRIGLKKRAEAGLWRGGGKVPFGYKYDLKKGILIPNEEEVETLQNMINLYISGHSFQKIARVVGMDESLVEKRILNKTNLGYVPYKGDYFDGQHEKIVSEQQYKEIEKVNKLRSKTKNARRYLFSGKIYCGECGAKYRYQKWGKKTICYCYSKQKSKPQFVKDPNCNNIKIDKEYLEKLVLNQLFSFKLDKQKLEKQSSQLNLVVDCNKIRAKITSQIENLLTCIADKIAIIESKEKIKKLEQKREEIRKELLTQEKDVPDKKIITIAKLWDYLDFSEQRFIIENIIEKITIRKTTLEIIYKV